MTYQRPRQRKGFVLSAVAWNRDGSIRSATYDPIRRARAEPDDPAQIAPARPGLIATEVQSQSDLFSAR